MTDKDGSIDLSLKNLWQTWLTFRKGKKSSLELDEFEYHLERNLFELHKDLNNDNYRHGSYFAFTVRDNKRREISVAPVRDRVVHRLIYDYLVAIYDKTFIFDVWSCRKGKGLVGAIERAQDFFQKSPQAYVWQADIKKFFDSVNHETLIQILARRVYDYKALGLIHEVIRSFPRVQREREREREHLLECPLAT